MTAAEVRALWPRAYEKTSGDSHYFLQLDGPISMGGHIFDEIKMNFDTSGKLKVVSLKVQSGFDYNKLFEDLSAQFGPPVSTDEKTSVVSVITKSFSTGPEYLDRSAVFRDANRKNTVKLEAWAVGSPSSWGNLTYRELQSGF